LLLLSPILVGWLIVRLPPDYFQQEERRPLESWDRFPLLRWVILIIKNLAGIVLLLAGLLMLLVPGQGLLTIVMGLVLLDFPGKFRLQRWLVTRRGVWRSLNWLRRRAHRPELKQPKED
jgi:Putative transmembrane protein (PGPGW)